MLPSKQRHRKRGEIIRAKKKPCFIAAVRYHNGEKELFRVKWADDIDDARAVLLSAVSDVRAILITESEFGEVEQED